jgi:predicted nucleic-acid-binding protein
MDVLDTNIIIRHLAQDIPDHAERAHRAFAEAEARMRTLLLLEGVLVETVQVLSSSRLYNLPRADIRRHLRRLIAMPAVEMPHKRTYLRALDLYEAHTRLAFVDCLCLAHAEQQGNLGVLSFDEGFAGEAVRGDTPVRRVVP